MKSADESASSIEFGPFRLDPAKRTLHRGTQKLVLQSRAFETLRVLVENHGKVVDKKTLMELVWPDTAVEENNLAQTVAAIRKALGEQAGENRYIATVPGRGYSFIAELRIVQVDLAPYQRRSFLRRAAVLMGAIAVVGGGIWVSVSNRERESNLSPLSASTGVENRPSFSPDGRQVVYVWTPEGEEDSGLFVKLIGAGEPVRITSRRGVTSPAWSPDGRFVAFIAWPGDVYIVPAIGGTEMKIVSLNLPLIDAALAWFPDGKRLAVADRNPETGWQGISEVSLETGNRRGLTTGVSRFGDRKPAVSPDGKMLAFVRYPAGGISAVYLMPTGGGDARQLTKYEERAFDLAWDANSRAIVYCARAHGPSTLWRIPASGGTPKRISVMAYGRIRGLSVAPDGMRLAFSLNTAAAGGLWRVQFDAATPPRKIAPSAGDTWGGQFSPDGKRLVFASTRGGTPEIWVSNREGGELLQLTSMGGPHTSTPRWSPDGTEICFDSRPGDNVDIFAVSANGGAVRRLTSHPGEDATASLSRDGKSIYFSSNRTGTFQIWKVPRQGGDAIQVTQRGGWAPLESPDGTYLYYVNDTEPEGVWRRSSAGGPEMCVMPKQQMRQRRWGWWTITDQGIAYLDENSSGGATLKNFSLATNTTVTLTAFPRVPVPGPAFGISPDGRTVVYYQGEPSQAKIMLLDHFR